mmetsp:Transcript_126970/g.365207  ORF Transcript_126970/g.365207 Transcript_126970/m.365207 type:complete len:244 (+) Transcript_126970:106-837(+)
MVPISPGAIAGGVAPIPACTTSARFLLGPRSTAPSRLLGAAVGNRHGATVGRRRRAKAAILGKGRQLALFARRGLPELQRSRIGPLRRVFRGEAGAEPSLIGELASSGVDGQERPQRPRHAPIPWTPGALALCGTPCAKRVCVGVATIGILRGCASVPTAQPPHRLAPASVQRRWGLHHDPRGIGVVRHERAGGRPQFRRRVQHMHEGKCVPGGILQPHCARPPRADSARRHAWRRRESTGAG